MWLCPKCFQPTRIERRGGRGFHADHGDCEGSGALAAVPRQPSMPRAFPIVREPGGLPVCRYCSDVVLAPRRTWCSDECVRAAQIECGWVQVIRKALWGRDRGVCRRCGLDCKALPGRSGRSGEWVWRYVEDWAKLLGMGFSPKCAAWEADHVVPVAEGGGGCGLDGYRTLCRPCHVLVTAELRRRMSRSRRRKHFEDAGGVTMPRQLELVPATP